MVVEEQPPIQTLVSQRRLNLVYPHSYLLVGQAILSPASRSDSKNGRHFASAGAGVIKLTSTRLATDAANAAYTASTSFSHPHNPCATFHAIVTTVPKMIDVTAPCVVVLFQKNT